MAEIKAKSGESRMDMIRRAQNGDTLVFRNECLEHSHHCFDGNKGHNCFNCCYCSLPNDSERQFRDDVAKDFERVHGKKFLILPATAQPIYEKAANIRKIERQRILKWLFDDKNGAMGPAGDFNSELIVVDLEKLKKVIDL